MKRHQETREHQYRLKRLQAGSDRYGCCEVCGESVALTYMQSGFELVTRPNGSKLKIPVGGGGLFGHKSCLELQRRPS